MSGPVVFISYSHDSDEHRDKVLGLAVRLRQDGLEARIDQQVNGTPEQGWPRWMLDQLDEANFVLAVCTETYYRRFRGHEEPGRGKGADWEGAHITQEIYDSRSRTIKFVPVMLSGGQERFIPDPLRSHTYYELTSEKPYQALYAFLRGQADTDLGPVGAMRPVEKRTAQPLTFPPASADTPSSPSRPAMIGVPHRNPFFAGREPLLSQLHRQLQKQGISALAQAAIHGLGGIGKTQTATEYAHRFGDHYRFVLWVVAESESAIRAAYLSIARELGLAEAAADLDTALLAVKAWLSREDGWLLIFDNADDPALVRHFLPPARTGGKVLLTSRARSFTSVGIREPFRVETLEPEDAAKFLIQRAGDADAQAAAALAAELGHLPLALEQAAAYIETVGGGLDEYLARYRRQGVALFAKGKPTTDYPRTVATTWTLSFAAVREASPASAELLTAAAFLVPDSIPIEIFTRGGSEFGDPLARQLEGVVEDQLVFWELLEPLERYSLVERLIDDGFKLHRLTQEVIKDSLGEEGRKDWAERVVRALDAAYPDVEFSNWGVCEKLQPHALQAAKLVQRFRISERSAGRLLAQAGYFSKIRGDDLGGARKLQEQSLEILEYVKGGEHPDTLNSRNNLAATLVDLGYLADARKLHEQTLEILERVQGAEHPDTLNSRNNLADTLRRIGDLAGARKLHEQTLEIRERVLGVDHPDTLTSRSNLATTLWALGDLAGARKLEEEILEIRERVLGVDHPDTTLSTWNLLLTIHQLNEADAAARLIDKLRWLLERDEGSIPSAKQREIRKRLFEFLEAR
ncbi:MAG TPA: FxSxx-COOH system tetratricopeptide repeat protein [Thermoanaerobaculia bacterium]|nr:FxSxx-COOH system tetratricopeptide repeat protein [Thermoanaerobaculia bacterium]